MKNPGIFRMPLIVFAIFVLYGTAVFSQAQNLPDLVISAFGTQPSPSYLPANTPMNFTVSVKNIGATAWAVRGRLLKLDVGGRLFYLDENANVDQHTGGTSSTPWWQAEMQHAYVIYSPPIILPAGTYTCTVTVDPDNLITESRENNNSSTMTINVTAALPRYVIEVESVNVSPKSGDVSTRFVISARAINIGLGYGPTGPIRLIDGGVLGSVTAEPPTRQQPRPFSFVFNPTAPGTFTFPMTIDPDNRIAEDPAAEGQSNRTRYAKVIVVESAPDWKISRIDPVPARGDTTTQFTLNVALTNNGGPAGVGGTMKLVSGGPLGVASGSPLGRNETRQIPFALSSKVPGTYRFTFQADPENRVVESKENNNSQSISVFVDNPRGQLPDLAIGEVTVTKTGQTRLNVVVEIVNKGSGWAIVSPKIKFVALSILGNPPSRARFDTGKNVDAETKIGPGKTIKMTIPVTTDLSGATKGANIKVVIDPDNKIGDANMADNVSTRPLGAVDDKGKTPIGKKK